MAADRVGKTEGIGAYEVTGHLTGIYPAGDCGAGEATSFVLSRCPAAYLSKALYVTDRSGTPRSKFRARAHSSASPGTKISCTPSVRSDDFACSINRSTRAINSADGENSSGSMAMKKWPRSRSTE